MKPMEDTVGPPAPGDPTLRWTLRILGFVLAAGAVFFLTRDYRIGEAAVWFLCSCAGLGTLSLVASWWPVPQRDVKDMVRSALVEQHSVRGTALNR